MPSRYDEYLQLRAFVEHIAEAGAGYYPPYAVDRARQIAEQPRLINRLNLFDMLAVWWDDFTAWWLRLALGHEPD